MKRTISILFIILCGILSSCDEKDGIQDDTIKLSKDKLTFSYTASKQIITTKSDRWWVANMKVDGERVSIPKEINTSEPFEFKGEWYNIIKGGTKTIEISVDENMTGKSRELYIELQAGNWFGSRITIVQKEK